MCLCLTLLTLVSEELIEQSVDYLLAAQKSSEKDRIIFTGQIAIETRRDNLEHGIPVHEKIWDEILAL